MTFTIYSLLSLLATLTNLLFGIFVLLRNPRSPVNRLWSLTIACLIPWGLGEFILRTVHDYETADLVSRISGIGFCLIPSFFLHFALVFCKRQDLLRRRWITAALYGPGIFFSVLEVLGHITTMIYMPWGFARTPSGAYVYYLIWLESFFATGLFFCYQKFKRAASRHDRYQALFVFLGVVIPLSVGTINDAILPLLGTETIRISVLSTTFTAGLITYAIVRFQLMALTPQGTAGNILRTMGELLAVVDELGFVQYTNPAFQQATRVSPSMVERFHMRHFIREADDILAQLHPTSKDGEITRSFRVSYLADGGSTIPVSLLVSSIVDHGTHVGYLLLARDIAEELRLQQELAGAARQREQMLRRYANSIQRVQEDERQRIARELHDDLCQRLSAVRLEMDMVELDFTEKRRIPKNRLRYLKRQIDALIADVRQISTNLRPATLDDFGLITALKLLCKEFDQLKKARVIFQSTNGHLSRYDSDVEIALFRIGQEALSNAAKHARATRILVQLAYRNNSLQLTVQDNGKGFNNEAVSHSGHRGLGLITMKERAELLGGQYLIETAPRKGTKIYVEIPLKRTSR